MAEKRFRKILYKACCGTQFDRDTNTQRLRVIVDGDGLMQALYKIFRNRFSAMKIKQQSLPVSVSNKRKQKSAHASNQLVAHFRIWQ